MTQTNPVVSAAKTPKARAWYGVSAREFKALIAAEKNPVRLAEMRDYAASTAKRRAAKSPRFAAKWEAIALSLSGTPTVKPKASRKVAKAAAVDPIDALLKATGMTAHDLLLAISAKIA